LITNYNAARARVNIRTAPCYAHVLISEYDDLYAIFLQSSGGNVIQAAGAMVQ
jgi:hypothetical protein